MVSNFVDVKLQAPKLHNLYRMGVFSYSLKGSGSGVFSYRLKRFLMFSFSLKGFLTAAYNL